MASHHQRTHVPAASAFAVVVAILVVCAASTHVAEACPHNADHDHHGAPRRTDMRPRHSDVTMRSLSWHKTPVGSRYTTVNLTTFGAAQGYHASRLDWLYITDPAFFANATALGLSASATINANLPDTGSHPATYQVGRVHDVHGKLVVAPWMASWPDVPYRGCVNAPEYQTIMQSQVKAIFAAGSVGLQHDDAGLNVDAVEFGGCYCKYCMAAFTPYALKNMDAAAIKQYGITPQWSLKNYSLAQMAKDPSWKTPADLKSTFTAFQTQSTLAYVGKVRDAANAAAGYNVTLSCNNGGRWDKGGVYQAFDFGLGEMAHDQATPYQLTSLFLTEPARVGVPQVMTMPKHKEPAGTHDDEVLTQKTIAFAYAIGGNVMVPYDIYIPWPNAPRFFGNVSDFDGLYALVRNNTQLFDGFTNATAITQEAAAQYATTNLTSLWALTRVPTGRVRDGPGDEAPSCDHDNAELPLAVVHLVDWGFPNTTVGTPVRVSLNNTAFTGSSACTAVAGPTEVVAGALSVQVLSPDGTRVTVSGSCSGGETTFTVPVPKPWVMLTVSAGGGLARKA